MVAGLNREIGCNVGRIQFVTPTVGYLVAKTKCVGPCEFPPILAKTEDGGESWRFFVGPGDPDVVGATDLFFTDENTGIVRTTDGKLSRTTDGGQTWKGLLASVGTYSKLIFADPEVGWALEFHEKMSFTVDGGNRWSSRAFRFPATPRAWSFPRRDRAYLVGNHGMVFRYSVVPNSAPMRAGSMPAPAMPAFASPLDAQVNSLETVVGEVAAAAEQMPAGTGASADTSGVATAGGADAPPSALVGACCGKPVNKLQAILDLVVKSLPSFAEKFKNTNLLAAGLRMVSTMPSELGALRNAVREFRAAQSREGATAALERVATAAGSLRSSTKLAFQKPQ
jgi:hypothetical protein